MDALSRTQLIDALLEAYVDWREACTRANETYRAGTTETGPRGRVAFGLYLTALDAEEEAAAAYARVVRRVAKLPGGEEPAAESRGSAWRVGRP